MNMNNYFLKVTDLETQKYTDYMLNEYLPKSKIYNEDIMYVTDTLSSKCELVDMLEKDLREKYNFPYKVDYFLVFHHRKKQNIHVDMGKTIRYTSLNLPLQNYENSKMTFYQAKEIMPIKLNDGMYFPESVEPVITVEGENQWILVNSGVPHKVTCNRDLPRTTLCIRFKTNPKFEEVVKYFGPA